MKLVYFEDIQGSKYWLNPAKIYLVTPNEQSNLKGCTEIVAEGAGRFTTKECPTDVVAKIDAALNAT